MMKKQRLFYGAMILMAGLLAGCAGASSEQNNVDLSTAAAPDVEVEALSGIPEDFMTGADLSSYIAEKESGVTYYDFEGNALDDAGFFKLLADGGVNYVRIRLWNDPTDDKGHTYGGGHCDLDTVTELGKLATQAGMKVLLDFHYSDFWADPGKQKAPKAWDGMAHEDMAQALYDFTKESLQHLLAEGVDVGMVQIGNEITNGLCGTSYHHLMTELLSAGSKAVREVAAEEEREILIAVHYTNPEEENYGEYADYLDRYGVDYDVFASSYYPYWHGTLENLTAQLALVADTYGKKVMVAETSYVHTLTDYDGAANTESAEKGFDTFDYDISAQGQIDEVRAVMQAVLAVGEAGIGVCYWEPAWIPVSVYDETSADAAQVFAHNQEIWETIGSGWATSYAGAYDKDAALYYGGSAVDNEAWFTADGHPLSSVNTYKYIREGATLGEGYSRMEAEPVPEVEEVSSDLPGGAVNLLANPGFEEETAWEIHNLTGEACAIEDDTNNVLNGEYCLKFWDNVDFTFIVTQTVTLDAGTYHYGGWFEGGDCGDSARLALFATTGEVTDNIDEAEYTADTTAQGWRTWDNPELLMEIVEDVTEVTVGVFVQAPAGGWGAFDDLYLYKE